MHPIAIRLVDFGEINLRMPFSAQRKPRAYRGGIGCSYLLFVGLVTSGLLVINSMLVRSFIISNDELFDRFVSGVQSFPLFAGINSLQIVQFAQIFFPVVMIMLQFWLFDLLLDTFQRGRKETADPQIENRASDKG